ncbi:fasciclin domain-containing protein [Aestuariicoccus sp. MJ-SS9]|uniref:fasciclin domain-containing protein n=1 Tax=Aestuariicoccus sp. MJ-SS9 TaxID=3079855 RepID=UPI00290FFBE7|nr:fasciclin domain-containing protein [Aestuariicoccus sp. MJ-SS9]MDU8911140.1 fasciclin domain-containing protein [Aestuariicoccus sp. MJ-SS9]
MKTIPTLNAAAALCLVAGLAQAESHAQTGNPMVGGAAMFADKTIVENAVNSADHTTLVAAVKAADLVETLSSEGPFTVFAPTNSAFSSLAAGTVETLLEPENKAALQKVLTCHVVSASAMSDAIAGMIADDGGMHPVPTVGGCTLQARMEGSNIVLTDERGRSSTVVVADVMQSNGVIHVVDRVLLPSM